MLLNIGSQIYGDPIIVLNIIICTGSIINSSSNNDRIPSSYYNKEGEHPI